MLSQFTHETAEDIEACRQLARRISESSSISKMMEAGLTMDNSELTWVNVKEVDKEVEDWLSSFAGKRQMVALIKVLRSYAMVMALIKERFS